MTLTANLTQAVTVSGGTPTLVLNDGGIATYSSGSGSKALTFSYTVAAGQNTADLVVTAVKLNGASVGTGAITLTPGSSQTITDANGHVFSFGAVYSGQDHLILQDGVTYGAADTLALIDGKVWAHTSSGVWYSNDGSTWMYQPHAPSINSAVAADLSGAAVNPDGVLQIDTTTTSTGASAGTTGAATSGSETTTAATAPKLTSLVASGSGITAGAGTLHAGAIVTLTANLSEAVTVSGGTPTLVLNDGGTATYTGGSGTTALTFSYTVVAGQNTADLAVTSVRQNGAVVGSNSPTVAAGSGQSLTDASGHVFTFGGVYNGNDYLILRDGVGDGVGTSLTLVDGTVWDKTASWGWYADNAGHFVYQPNPPSLGSGTIADLSAAVANPVGLLQIDTQTFSSYQW